ncbi:MAG TPA: hypothetical protein VGG99_21250 [Acetobacteraceae bacterium]|jgi:hypothetical protein
MPISYVLTALVYLCVVIAKEKILTTLHIPQDPIVCVKFACSRQSDVFPVVLTIFACGWVEGRLRLIGWNSDSRNASLASSREPDTHNSDEPPTDITFNALGAPFVSYGWSFYSWYRRQLTKAQRKGGKRQ